eukprot:scaffold4263_cov260-Prasinococcus_capsulatus_cf.AAC.2
MELALISASARSPAIASCSTSPARARPLSHAAHRTCSAWRRIEAADAPARLCAHVAASAPPSHRPSTKAARSGPATRSRQPCERSSTAMLCTAAARASASLWKLATNSIGSSASPPAAPGGASAATSASGVWSSCACSRSPSMDGIASSGITLPLLLLLLLRGGTRRARPPRPPVVLRRAPLSLRPAARAGRATGVAAVRADGHLGISIVVVVVAIAVAVAVAAATATAATAVVVVLWAPAAAARRYLCGGRQRGGARARACG